MITSMSDFSAVARCFEPSPPSRLLVQTWTRRILQTGIPTQVDVDVESSALHREFSVTTVDLIMYVQRCVLGLFCRLRWWLVPGTGGGRHIAVWATSPKAIALSSREPRVMIWPSLSVRAMEMGRGKQTWCGHDRGLDSLRSVRNF